MNFRFESGEEVMESRRKIEFLGFTICIESLKQLYSDM